MHQVKRVDEKTKQGFENKFLYENCLKFWTWPEISKLPYTDYIGKESLSFKYR